MLTPTVKDIQQMGNQPQNLLTVGQDNTVKEAAKLMSDNNVGCVLVYDGKDNFVGVLTERDILAKVVANADSPPNSVLVSNVMTPKAISCTADTTVEEAEKLMAEHKIRHLPVVKDGRPLGMVSSRDIVAFRLLTNKAMQTAAEQLAKVSIGLKNLDFDDFIASSIDEVPKTFAAQQAVLYLAQKDSKSPIIYRRACYCSEENLKRIKQLCLSGQVVSGRICQDCKNLDSHAEGLLIPLGLNATGKDSPHGCGFICMCQFKPSAASSKQINLYKASLLREMLNVNLINAKLSQDYHDARRDSEIDPLTGVGTRRVLNHVLAAEHNRVMRYKSCFSIAILDIDNFKNINDTAGHAAGDDILRQLAKIMRDSVRTSDVIVRYGGDEFILVMPETKLSEAARLVDRLRKTAQTISVPNVESVTISCGVAEANKDSADTLQTLLAQADSALYEAKQAGRNRVTTASAP